MSAATADTVESVTPRGDLKLASGRILKLSGIRFPEPGLGADGAAFAALERLRGRPVQVALTGSGEPDRWGRLAATLTEGIDDPSDVAGTLVDAGLAVVDAGESDSLCRPGLLALEAGARRARKGVWAEGAAGPVPADDTARLNAFLGRFVLIEGRVHGVGERRTRTYLDFGPFGRKAATVTVPKRTWARMRDRGLTAATLKGRTVRARGVLESWRGGAVMDIVSPEAIELLDVDEARGR
jgi:endonuclease YncB( thermonuclease family)